MEQFVLFTLEKSLVKFEYHRVLVRFLDDRGVVCIVQTLALAALVLSPDLVG